MKRTLIVLFCVAACFGIGSAAWNALGFGDVTQAFEEASDPNAPHPVVDYVDYPDHEFGVMDVNAKGHHVFRIGNKGSAPLKLEKGPSSCQCTMGNLVDNTILPGEVGEIELRWETPPEEGEFAQGVTIWTNDLNEPALVYRVLGNTRADFSFEPAELLYPHLEPGMTPEGEFCIFAHKDESLRVLQTTDEASQWIESIEPVSAEELANHEALAGYRIKVRMPADLPAGYFVRRIPVILETSADKAEPGDEAGRKTRQRVERYSVRGTVRSSAVVFGHKIESDGVLRIGVLLNGEGAQEDAMVVLRDTDESLEIQDIDFAPEWMKVTVTQEPSQKESEKLFRVRVEIPKDAPICSYMGDGAQPIRIKTNHPRIPVIRIMTEFAVLSPGVKRELH